MSTWADKYMDGLIHGQINLWIGEYMRADKYMDGWMDGWVKG